MGNSGSSGRLHHHHDEGRRHYQPQLPPQHGPRQHPPPLPSKFHQHKVLLDLNTAPKLRPTENGQILHNGGTLSQRRMEKGGPPSKTGTLRRGNFYGSEPDLRVNSKEEVSHISGDNASKLRISRNNRKKYKAPVAPHYEHHNDFFDDWEEKPSRRLRLFITRAEAKRKNHEHAATPPPPPQDIPSSHMLPPPGGRLRRTRSTPQFQQNQETKVYDDEPTKSKGECLESDAKPLHSVLTPNNADNSFGNSFLEELREKQLQRESKFNRSQSRNSQPKDPAPKASREQKECDEENLWLSTTKSPVTVKTFYFGMDEPVDDPFGLESFTPKTNQNVTSLSSSDSHLSSSIDGFADVVYDETSEGISVQLRATLPRKQVEIPRFSPAAAWRLLSTVETVVPSPPPSTEEDVIESRIQPPHPLPIQIPAILPDKSADSGISGDASPQQYDSAAWTPQQDLEETSSDGGGFPSEFVRTGYDPATDVRYTPRFTLSLPKDDKSNPLFSYNEMLSEAIQQQQGLGSSYPFAKVFPNPLPEPPFVDNNWMLSCSIPSSVNFSSNPTQQSSNEEPFRSFQEEDPQSSLIKRPSFSYLTSGGHIMYLPEYSKQPGDSKIFSRSCENLSKVPENEEQHSLPNSDPQRHSGRFKTKKFTFQSTIRQNERKMIAEKLSKIAEYTELKRRSEQEVMQKVEEEFQKKREREKADIRQQLRLYNINKKALASLESYNSNP